MLRVKVPQGVISSPQLRALADIGALNQIPNLLEFTGTGILSDAPDREVRRKSPIFRPGV